MLVFFFFVCFHVLFEVKSDVHRPHIYRYIYIYVHACVEMLNRHWYADIHHTFFNDANAEDRVSWCRINLKKKAQSFPISSLLFRCHDTTVHVAAVLLNSSLRGKKKESLDLPVGTLWSCFFFLLLLHSLFFLSAFESGGNIWSSLLHCAIKRYIDNATVQIVHWKTQK